MTNPLGAGIGPLSSGGGGAAAPFSGASISQSNTNALSATWTPIIYQVTDFDVGGWVHVGRDYLTVLQNGKILVIACAKTVNVAYGILGVGIDLDVGAGFVNDKEVYGKGNNPSPAVCLAVVRALNAGDKIRARFYQDSGAGQNLDNLGIHNYLQAVYLGA